MLLSQNARFTRAKAAVAAGQTPVQSDVIDTQNVESVCFLIILGAIVAGAVCSVKLQQGDAADLSDAVDLKGTTVNVADTKSNGVLVLEVKRPTKRYIRAVISRATQNVTVDGILAVSHGLRSYPPINGATIIDTVAVAGPEEV